MFDIMLGEAVPYTITLFWEDRRECVRDSFSKFFYT